MSKSSYVVITLILTFLSVIFCVPVKVTLPSYEGPPLDVYSGFISVDDVKGRALFYILIKAESDPQDKPLVVWYQGGPGCSGLLGLFNENGPLTPSRDSTGKTKLTYSNLGWTQFANVLWLEQPAFVGFSYSNTSSDIQTNDTKSASDNFQFLEKFLFKEFPEFLGRKLWFTGESYGGVYVPMLSDLVVGSSVIKNQFQGFMIGNPVFNCQPDGAFLVQQLNLLYWHGLASYTNYNNWTTNGCNDPNQATTKYCQDILNMVFNQLGVIDQELFSESSVPPKTWPSIDPDDIFQDFCTGNGTLDFAATPTPDDPCIMEIGNMAQEYLNRVDVQQALGVKPTKWQVCTNLQYSTNVGSLIPYYQDILMKKPDTSLLIYSGDLDILTVPFAFTQPCIPQFGGTSKSLWQPWFVNGATAGYYEEFESCTYATVKGAGHETPQYQPLTAYQMIYRFLTTGSLDTDTHLPKVTGKGYRKGRLSQSTMLRKVGVPGHKF